MTVRSFAWFAAVSLSVLAGAACPAAAQDAASSDIRVDLGGGGAVQPAYMGGKALRLVPVPMFDVSGLLFNRLSASTGQGAALNAFQVGGLSAGVNVNYSAGRSRSDGSRLNGLPEISGAAAVSGFVTYTIRPISFRAEISRRLGADSGTTASFGADYTLQPLPGLQLSAGPRVVIADRDYERTFFGVSEAAALRATALGNPLRPYDPSAGIRDVAFAVSARYALDDRWTLRGRIGLSELMGDAANSPLTQRKTAPSVSLGLTYRFM